MVEEAANRGERLQFQVQQIQTGSFYAYRAVGGSIHHLDFTGYDATDAEQSPASGPSDGGDE